MKYNAKPIRPTAKTRGYGTVTMYENDKQILKEIMESVKEAGFHISYANLLKGIMSMVNKNKLIEEIIEESNKFLGLEQSGQ